MCLCFAELIQPFDLVHINLPWLIFIGNLMSKTTGPKSSRANVGKTGGAVGVQVAEGNPGSPRFAVRSFTPPGCWS